MVNRRVMRLPLALGHVGRVDLDAALGPAEGDVDQRGLPRHQRRQGADLVEVDRGVVADAALVRTPGAVVLDPESLEHQQRAVVAAAPAPGPTPRGRRW